MEEQITRRAFVGTLGALALALAAGAGLSGCGGPRGTSSASAPDLGQAAGASASAAASSASAAPSAASADQAGKSLIVLWSWSGNTLQMAERLSELSGAEIYRIEAADPYPEDYDECADRAKREQDDGVYPAIANPVQNWGDYDTVFLGYPIWWYELPMIVQGFVNDHGWNGKTIVPFNSHEGSGDGGTYADLREMSGATVLDGLAIRGGEVAGSLGQVDAWYAGLGL